MRFDRGRDGRPGLFRLGCSQFDAEPPTVSMIDPTTRAGLPMEQWTPGVPHSVHPVTGKPFVRLQGTAEYHTHHRTGTTAGTATGEIFRLKQTVLRLLQKAGVGFE